jgi:UDP-N-acetylmuramoyl-L-alanyl-D-glutamate--2,6-diaminopimelate ligase
MLLRDLFASLPLTQKQGGEACLDQKVAGLNADSRKIEQDFLFIGVPGSQVDGAKFLPQVIEKGALAAIISDTSDIPVEGVPADFPIFCCADVHGALAALAGTFYPVSYEKIAAVTGTNGKTSIASFLRQIWANAGKSAANIGTIGIEGPNGASYGGLTTPDPVGLLKSVQALEAEQGVTHLALEASSHGLEQKRLDGLKVDVGAYTNLTRDHLDYHKTFEAYRDAKLQLFTRLVREGGAAVINLDDENSPHFLEAAKARGLTCLTLGEAAEADLHIKAISFDGEKQIVSLAGVWGDVEAHIPLVGTFQASNALVAGLMAYASGLQVDEILNALSQLKGACGRMELVGKTEQGAPIYVDYSHTPDSLETALKALRPFTKERLIVVFGAGGDRDPGKRPMMGKAANDHSDFAIVTDDNPRSEDPALIRKAVMETVEMGCEVGGRYDAIAKGVSMLQAGDILLVAGKGHEQGQTVKGEVLPFSDHEAVQQVLKEQNEGAAS